MFIINFYILIHFNLLLMSAAAVAVGGTLAIGVIKSMIDKDDKEEENKKLKNEINNLNNKFNCLVEKINKEEKDKKEANDEWKKEKLKIINNFCSNLKFDINEIKNIINLNFDNLNKEINDLLNDVKNNTNFQDNVKQVCRDKITNYINNGDLNLNITNLNIILIGKTGSGKSTFINEFLQLNGEDRAEEGHTINPGTVEIKRYPRVNRRGITLTDTVGIEVTNKERGIPAIKEQLKKHFNDNLTDINNSIHSIFYCVKNDHKCEKGEREFIKELTELYQNKIPIIILITQYENECLNKIYDTFKERLFPNIDIIKVLAREIEFGYNGQIIPIKPFGLKETKDTCINKIPEAITSAFIELVSTKIKDDYYNNDYQIKKPILKNFNNLFRGFNSIFDIIFYDKRIINRFKNKINNMKKKFDEICDDYYNKFLEKYASKKGQILAKTIAKKRKERDVKNLINDNQIDIDIAENNIKQESNKRNTKNIIMNEMLKYSFDIFENESVEMIKTMLGNSCLNNSDLLRDKIQQSIEILFNNINASNT